MKKFILGGLAATAVIAAVAGGAFAVGQRSSEEPITQLDYSDEGLPNYSDEGGLYEDEPAAEPVGDLTNNNEVRSNLKVTRISGFCSQMNYTNNNVIDLTITFTVRPTDRNGLILGEPSKTFLAAARSTVSLDFSDELPSGMMTCSGETTAITEA
jgi:hypothetical protein